MGRRRLDDPAHHERRGDLEAPGNSAGAWAFSLTFVDALHGWAAGESLVATSDGGKTWALQQINHPDWLFGVDFTSNSTGVIVGQLGGVFTTGDGGEYLAQPSNGAPTEVYGMDANDSLHAWAVGTFGETQYTVDGGTTWNRVRVGNPYGHIYGVDFAPDNTRGWLAGDGDQSDNYGVIYRSVDGGKDLVAAALHGRPRHHLRRGRGQWSPGGRRERPWIHPLHDRRRFHVANSGARRGLAAERCQFHRKTGWVAGNQATVEKSTDGGRTWVLRNPHPGYNAAFMDVSFADRSNGWVVGFYGDVFHTTNGGRTWQRQTVQGAGDTAFLDIEPSARRRPRGSPADRRPASLHARRTEATPGRERCCRASRSASGRWRSSPLMRAGPGLDRGLAPNVRAR
jgi:photosystem II stability/assembly factor-like uncharacterized protein